MRRLRIDVAGGMRLGGKPNELLAQVESKHVDMAWILAAYSPGRFPRLEVFELPFIASSRASVTSQALFEYYETYARDELSNVHVLNVWCHPSGVILRRSALNGDEIFDREIPGAEDWLLWVSLARKGEF